MTIIQKVTTRNLKLNKVRSITTIIGIMLSAALITIVLAISSSSTQTRINNAIQYSGDYDFRFEGYYSESDYQELTKNSKIKYIYTKRPLGIAKLEQPKNKYVQYVSLYGLNKECFSSGFDMELSEGRFPTNDKEILLSPEFLTKSTKEYKVGDSITLQIGHRSYTDKTNNIEQEYIPSESFYMGSGEIFNPETQKTYTICGILKGATEDIGTNSYSACINAFTLSSLNDKAFIKEAETDRIFVRLNDNEERNYTSVIAEILDIDETLLKRSMTGELTISESQELASQVTHSSSPLAKKGTFMTNSMLTSAKGFDRSPTESLSLLLTGLVIMTIIAFTSASIIRSSFNISITEKIRYFGMLSSMGARPRQIRRSVFFEGFVLALIGIPLGIILGVLASLGLVNLSNALLSEIIAEFGASSKMIFAVSPLDFLIAAAVGMFTIMLSALGAAVTASHISPIEAIRSNNDIKISGRKKAKKKTYKAPRFISRFFGIGGTIAWKNMKRSKKQYRTTVISIVISVAIYLTMSSFVDYQMKSISDMYENSGYNFNVSLSTRNADDYDKLFTTNEIKDIIGRVTSVNEVKKSISTITFSEAKITLSPSEAADKLSEVYSDYDNDISIDNDKFQSRVSLVAIDDNSFKTLMELSGNDYESNKMNAILYNRVHLSNIHSHKFMDTTFMKFDKAKTASFEYVDYDAIAESNNEGFYDEITGEYISVQEDTDSAATNEPEKEVDALKRFDIKIVGATEEKLYLYAGNTVIENPVVMISFDKLNSLQKDHPYIYESAYVNIAIQTDEADKLQDTLVEMSDNDKSLNMSIENYDKIIRMMSAAMAESELFMYGFVIIIALIGLTNIFNTITTNIRLRRKEFAMLQSIGMTKAEFNRMISLESILYSLKALLIGIPIGIAGSYILYLVFSAANYGNETSYIFPGISILVSVLVVMLIIWMIMRFSIRKIKKQNIIETIRNDNI